MSHVTILSPRFSLAPLAHTTDARTGAVTLDVATEEVTDTFAVGPLEITSSVTGWSDHENYLCVINAEHKSIPATELTVAHTGMEFTVVHSKLFPDQARVMSDEQKTHNRVYLFVEDGFSLALGEDHKLRLFLDLRETTKGVVRVGAPPPRSKKIPVSENIFYTKAYTTVRDGGGDTKDVTKYVPQWDVFSRRDYYLFTERDREGRYTSVRVTYTERPVPPCTTAGGFSYVDNGQDWGHVATAPNYLAVQPCVELSAIEPKVYIHPALLSQRTFSTMNAAEAYLRQLNG